jgi:hypothetical protein
MWLHFANPMISTIRKESNMKARSLTERGQALILISLAAIGFFGIVGLAIDGSAKFSDRRHAQNAADTAAVAGALALARNQPLWYMDASNRALENGYDDDHVSNDVWIYNPPHSGIYSNCSDIHFTCTDYVQVIIDSTVDTWFARVIGINQTHNHVEAVASKIAENNSYNFGGNAVVALAPDGCALMSQGNTSVTVVGGGLYSNSDDPSCSFKKTSCAGTTMVTNADGTQGAITMVGGASLNLGCMPSASVVPAGVKQLPFPPPYKEIAPPAECAQPKVTVSGNPTTVVLSPGHYGSMPPKSNMKDVTLKPGVYCIDNEIRFGAGDNFRVEGTFPSTPGVFLYIQSGGSFTFNGGSTINIWGINDASVLSDSNLLKYRGYLIYAAPNYSTGTPATCTINGNTSNTFRGTIYAPYCNITMDGTSSPTGFQSQIIGYNVKFNGGATIYLSYEATSSPVWSIPLQVGLTQ